jgi:hypothetical protein
MEGIGKKTLKTLKTKKLAAKQQEKEKYKGLGSKSESEKYTDLGSKSDKEMEIEEGLSAEEQAAYERLEKQGMSDQGIVSPNELKKTAGKVAEKVKEFGKGFVKGFKDTPGKIIKGATNAAEVARLTAKFFPEELEKQVERQKRGIKEGYKAYKKETE